MLESNSAEAVYDTGGDSEYAVACEDYQPNITTRYARSEDIIEFWGEPHSGTIRAVVAEMDGRVVGIIGVVREGPIGKYFCNFHEDLQPYLKSVVIMRAVKQSIEFVKDYKGPVLSLAESVEGCKMLNRLGFTHLQGVYYGWHR